MKVKILQRSVYYKTAEIEIDIDQDVYDHWRLDNGKYASLDEYLGVNDEMWVDKLDEAISEAPLQFGLGMDNGANWTDQDQDSELRYECEKLKIGGHL